MASRFMRNGGQAAPMTLVSTPPRGKMAMCSEEDEDRGFRGPRVSDDA
jgi:hypothetical protein